MVSSERGIVMANNCDHRCRASDVRPRTTTSSRHSVHPACSTVQFQNEYPYPISWFLTQKYKQMSAAQKRARTMEAIDGNGLVPVRTAVTRGPSTMYKRPIPITTGEAITPFTDKETFGS